MKLSPTQIEKAVKWNPVYGRQVGWDARYSEVVKLLGFGPTVPPDDVFAEAVADWQDRHKPLAPDGMIGTSTWTKMEPQLSKAPVAPPAPPLPPVGDGPRWLQYAQTEGIGWSGMSAFWGKDKNKATAEKFTDWDEKYFRAAPFFGGHRHADGIIPHTSSPDWCAAFVNWCLHRAGYSHTGSGRAGSFLDEKSWRFDALTEPRKGCVLVPGNGAHVTFLWHWTGTLKTRENGDVVVTGGNVMTLGGNQGKRVQVVSEHRRLTAARGRNGVTSPFLWPLPGEPICGIRSVPSEQGHFCRFNPV